MRAWIYDKAIGPLTGGWYREVLARIPDNARVLDVGIGTGGALCENARTVSSKSLQITGVDIDQDYVRRARKAVAAAGLDARVAVRLESIYDHDGGPYEAVYFSASFMLMPDPEGALSHVKRLLTSQGRIYFTQTFEHRRSRQTDAAKPLLKKLTTIDFGSETYEEDFVAVLERAGLEVEEWFTLGSRGPRSFRLTVTRPS